MTTESKSKAAETTRSDNIITAPPTPSLPPILAVFDFDHSLIGDNSDTWVFDVLAPMLGQQLKPIMLTPSPPVWTDFMDMSLGRLHEAGHKREPITRALSSIPMASGSIQSLSSLSQAGAICAIISDANTVFIDEILKAYKCRHYFTDDNIHTNPAHYDDSERLRVRYYHSDPHGCVRCPRNLCKGIVLDKLRAQYPDRRVVYLGDGGGDLCPSLRLKHGDVVLARDGWTLHTKLNKAISDDSKSVAAQVKAWTNWDDVYTNIASFIASPTPLTIPNTSTSPTIPASSTPTST